MFVTFYQGETQPVETAIKSKLEEYFKVQMGLGFLVHSSINATMWEARANIWTGTGFCLTLMTNFLGDGGDFQQIQYT